MITVRNLWKVYGPRPERVVGTELADLPRKVLEAQTGNVVAMRDIDLDVAPGEVFVVMGSVGQRQVDARPLPHAADRADVGHGDDPGDVDVTAADRDTLLDVRRHKVSMVFQHFGLLPHRTLVDNVAFGLEVRGVDKSQRRAQGGETLELVGLGGMGDVQAASAEWRPAAARRPRPRARHRSRRSCCSTSRSRRSTR